jgi:PAS domain S-box-containing protein
MAQPSPGPRAEQLLALHRLAGTVARAAALQDIYREACDCLERALHADRSSVLLFDPDAVMRFKASRNLSERYIRKVEGHSPWSRDEKSAVPILIPDVASEPGFDAYRATILEEGIRALAFIPIVSGETLLGKFMVYFNEPHAFGEEEVQLAQIIAAHIAFGVERTRAEEVLRKDGESLAASRDNLVQRKVAERRLAAEHAVTRILAESHSLAQAAPRILASVGECLGCAFAAFWRAEPGAAEIRCTETWMSPAVSADGFAALCRTMSFERGVGLPGRVWKAGAPSWIPDLSKDQNFPRLSYAVSAGLRSGFAFPVMVRDRFLGVMEFFLIRSAEPDQQLIEMMSAIGSEIGQFIERKQAEDSLATSEEITRSIIDNALDAVITMDSNGTVTGWNSQAERIFGWPAAEAMGRPLHEIAIPERHRAAHRAGLKQFHESGKGRIMDRRIEIEGLRRDGSEFPVELTVTAIRGGGSYCFSAFLRDITERKKNEERLREENKAKDDFLAMLAHELRNPLNPILSAVRVMEQVGPRDATLERVRGIIDRQVRHMAHLVDDLLDVSRISRGKILLRRERVDLVALVGATVEDHRGEIEASGHKVMLDLPSEALWVSGDPTRLSQVVGNVLQNANKFTDSAGTIRVKVFRSEEADEGVVRIQDSGIGMEARMLERVFDTFTQADRSLGHGAGGLGLGLALVKGLVALHGGSVHAASEGLGRGSEFSIRLPLGTAPPVEAEPVRRVAESNGSCRVLLIEDHADSSAGMELFLGLGGHIVTHSKTGQEGIDRARVFRPDVVLCDIGLEGGMDGYAVAETLRREPEFASTYLVAVTGYGREDDMRRSREAGFDLHLTKPVDPKGLEDLLREVAARLPAIRG